MEMRALILFAMLATIFTSVKSEDDDFIVEVLSPQGFRVSTENLPGVQRVGFRGNINRELLRHETAEYTGDFALHSNDFWVYENPSVSLKPGDVIYFRPQMMSGALGVLSFVREFHVPERDPSADDSTDIVDAASTIVPNVDQVDEIDDPTEVPPDAGTDEDSWGWGSLF